LGRVLLGLEGWRKYGVQSPIWGLFAHIEMSGVVNL
jgi:hypothetical protein